MAAVAAGAEAHAREMQGKLPGTGSQAVNELLAQVSKPPPSLMDALHTFTQMVAGQTEQHAAAWCPVALMHDRFDWEYHDEQLPPIAIAVDVSGSMSDQEVSFVYGMLNTLRNPSVVHHLQWDDARGSDASH
jgi:hypothetical protein